MATFDGQEVRTGATWVDAQGRSWIMIVVVATGETRTVETTEVDL